MESRGGQRRLNARPCVAHRSVEKLKGELNKDNQRDRSLRKREKTKILKLWRYIIQKKQTCCKLHKGRTDGKAARCLAPGEGGEEELNEEVDENDPRDASCGEQGGNGHLKSTCSARPSLNALHDPTLPRAFP